MRSFCQSSRCSLVADAHKHTLILARTALSVQPKHQLLFQFQLLFSVLSLLPVSEASVDGWSVALTTANRMPFVIINTLSLVWSVFYLSVFHKILCIHVLFTTLLLFWFNDHEQSRQSSQIVSTQSSLTVLQILKETKIILFMIKL